MDQPSEGENIEVIDITSSEPTQHHQPKQHEIQERDSGVEGERAEIEISPKGTSKESSLPEEKTITINAIRRSTSKDPVSNFLLHSTLSKSFPRDGEGQAGEEREGEAQEDSPSQSVIHMRSVSDDEAWHFNFPDETIGENIGVPSRHHDLPRPHERIFVHNIDYSDYPSIPDYKECVFVYGKQDTASYRVRDDNVGKITEIIKVIFIGFVLQLFWIRFFGIILSFFVAFVLLIIISMITRKSYENLGGFSRYLFSLITVVAARSALFFFGFWRIHIHRVPVKDFDAIRAKISPFPADREIRYNPFFIISNHVSIVDPFVIMLLFGPFSIVCKEGIKNVPFLGQACQLMQYIFVGSNTKETERKVRKREERYLQRITSSDPEVAKRVPPQLLIFPEGTTTTGNHIIRFHSGAFKTGQPVQPVFIDYPHKHFNMSWSKLGASYFVYCLGQVYNSCSVYILPPYVPNEMEKRDWKLYAYNVQRTLVEVGNLYRPLNKQLQMSNELFFRNPSKKLEHERKNGKSESSFHSRWKRFVDEARDHRDRILRSESLQTPIDDPTDFQINAFSEGHHFGNK